MSCDGTPRVLTALIFCPNVGIEFDDYTVTVCVSDTWWMYPWSDECIHVVWGWLMLLAVVWTMVLSRDWGLHGREFLTNTREPWRSGVNTWYSLHTIDICEEYIFVSLQWKQCSVAWSRGTPTIICFPITQRELYTAPLECFYYGGYIYSLLIMTYNDKCSNLERRPRQLKYLWMVLVNVLVMVCVCVQKPAIQVWLMCLHMSL